MEKVNLVIPKSQHCSACSSELVAQQAWLPYFQPVLLRQCVTPLSSLPHTRGQAAEEERHVALDERREEGKHAVDGEGDEEGLPSANAICQPAPHEGPDHHPQVHNQTWGTKRDNEKEGRDREECKKTVIGGDEEMRRARRDKES